jgi:predicted HTH transcriptional regulator
LIAEPLFRVKYVEKAGTGTTDMIADCRKAGLPEPDFEQNGPHFVVTLWRNWLTADLIASLELNDRQQRVVTHLKTAGRIGNTEYQSLLGVAKRTAHRDLMDLVEKGVLERIGTTGKGTAYVLRKGATKGPNGPSAPFKRKRAPKRTKGAIK